MILAAGAPLAARYQGDPSIPDRFVKVPIPVGAGYVDSMARPGGNATGFTLFEYGMAGKWLELLKEIAPRVTRVAVLSIPTQSADADSSAPSSPSRRRSASS